MSEIRLDEFSHNPENKPSTYEVDRLIDKELWGEIDDPNAKGLAKALHDSVLDIVQNRLPQMPEAGLLDTVNELLEESRIEILLYVKVHYKDEWESIRFAQTDSLFTKAETLQDEARRQLAELLPLLITEFKKKNVDDVASAVFVKYFDHLYDNKLNADGLASLDQLSESVSSKKFKPLRNFSTLIIPEFTFENKIEVIGATLEELWQGSAETLSVQSVIRDAALERATQEGYNSRNLKIRSTIFSFIDEYLREELESYILGKNAALFDEYLDSVVNKTQTPTTKIKLLGQLFQSILDFLTVESDELNNLFAPLISELQKIKPFKPENHEENILISKRQTFSVN